MPTFDLSYGTHWMPAPNRSITEIGDVEEFFRGLLEAMPTAEFIEFEQPLEPMPSKYRGRREGSEHVWHLSSGPWHVFRFALTEEFIDWFCEQYAIEPNAEVVLAFHILVLAPSGYLMTWYDWRDTPPWFAAEVDVERLRALAERCGGKLSEPFEPRSGSQCSK